MRSGSLSVLIVKPVSEMITTVEMLKITDTTPMIAIF